MATAETPKPVETKADKFKRLIEPRVSKALSAIANIGGLAAKTSYEYTDVQVAKVLAALEAEVAILKGRFEKPDAKPKGGFSID